MSELEKRLNRIEENSKEEGERIRNGNSNMLVSLREEVNKKLVERDAKVKNDFKELEDKIDKSISCLKEANNQLYDKITKDVETKSESLILKLEKEFEKIPKAKVRLLKLENTFI
jgi:hypothetical protein